MRGEDSEPRRKRGGAEDGPQGGAHRLPPPSSAQGATSPSGRPGPRPRTGGFSAGTGPVMGVLGITRDSIPCGDPVTPAAPAPTLKGIWVSGWWLARPGPHADKGSGHSPTPTSSTRYTTVSNALNIYFWGNYFLSIVEYTGNLQGNNASKTHFLFFKERLGIFIMFCFSK